MTLLHESLIRTNLWLETKGIATYTITTSLLQNNEPTSHSDTVASSPTFNYS